MTQLRDARLVRALEHAPDGQDLPSDASSRAIRVAARAAVTPAATGPWWRRWWSGDGGQRAPWSAALASVLLAGLVTVLWYDPEIPDAAPQSPRLEAPAGLPAPPASSAAPVPVLKAPESAAPRKTVDAAREKAVTSRAAETQRERRAEPAPQVRDAQQQPLAKSAPVQAEELRRADVAGVPPPAPPAPPATAAMPAPHAAAAAPAMRSQFAAGWTHLRLETDGRRIEVPREQASRLASLVDAMAASARDVQPLEEPVVARIETLRDGQPHGVLELAPPRIRWTARGAPALTAQPEPAQLQALRDELARLPGR